MSSSLTEKYRDIVEALYLKTKAGEINWSSLEDHDDKFIAEIRKYKFVISDEDSSDNLDERDIRISILDVNGILCETFVDTDINSETINVAGFGNAFYLMSELYRTARRQASGADIILDEILMTLDILPF